MPIIKDDVPIDDVWVELEEDGDVPSSGDVIVPLEILLEKSERLSNHTGCIGVLVPNDVDLEAHADLVEKVDLVVLQLPSFADGRAYSQARILRETLGYKGELRVKGDVLPDQAAYLKRCGFDSFDFEGVFDKDVWERSVSAMSTGYQRNYRDELEHRRL